mmetsp:Transcript_28581/g.68731  ORF Transcript_28581/g.68731 Transcript_28581/m.68731 type:complete len:503 (-) Transcript_28581:142-1650(-)
MTDAELTEIQKKATQYKDEGNDLFSKANYARAAIAYSMAIDECERASESHPQMHVFYCNRAFCHIKMENFGSAISDAQQSVELKADFAKAYYRRGVAHMALARYTPAYKDFYKLCQLAPSDRVARERMQEAKKLMNSEKFLKAIEMESSKPASETVKIEDIEMPSGYDGPIYEGVARLREDSAYAAQYLKDVLEYQKGQQNIPKRHVYQLVMDVIALLKTCSTVQHVDVPDEEHFNVCGDVHGQYYDLLNIFEINGVPSESNPYLFNGDFVDRGSFSVECIVALFVARLAYPNHVHLARGNHETKNMNKLYGFEGEVTAKYDQPLYELFCEAFCLLPLAHVLKEKVFVVHGGLFSKDGVTLDSLSKVDRVREPPDEGLMVEMLWSDPGPTPGRTASKRGVGVAFGPDVTADFLKTNKLEMVVRSHEMKEEGYEVEHGGKLVTIFSAPNYCDQMGNKGALMKFSGKDMANPKYTAFEAVPHPQIRPMQYANPMLMMGMMQGGR